MTSTTSRRVAIFDGSAPGLAFARSLASAGVEIDNYAPHRSPTNRSRSTGPVKPSPWHRAADPFIDWLVGEVNDGRIDLVAPTSDEMCFVLAQVETRIGRSIGNLPTPDAIYDCLFKGRFTDAMERAGLPTPPTIEVANVQEAVEAGSAIGFPVVLKPRSHAGGVDYRGAVVGDASALAADFLECSVGDGNESVRSIDPQVELPLVQAFVGGDDIDVVSVSGFLDRSGDLQAVALSYRTRSWGATGIGSEFRRPEPGPYVDTAVQAARAVIGAGVFELEVIVDRSNGDVWALDLNPRGFGQMAFDIAAGNDLPLLWYNEITGSNLTSPHARRPRRMPTVWRHGLTYHAGRAVGLALGPDRGAELRQWVSGAFEPRTGPMFRWSDPIPALADIAIIARHPGGLLRPLIRSARNP